MKRLLSLLLALILSCSVCLPAFAADSAMPDYSVGSLEEYEQLLESVCAQKSSTSRFDVFLHNLRNLIRFLTGQALLPDKSLAVDVDEEVAQMCEYICENSGLDIMKILTSIPECNHLAELTVKVFGINTEEMRRQMYQKADDLWREGDHAKSSLYLLLGTYFSIIDKCEITTKATKNPDVFQVYLRIHFRDGGTRELFPGIYINRVTGEAYGVDNRGLVSTGFNCDIYDLLVYAPVNAWMRQYGFCLFYDFFCYTSPDWMWNYVTRRFKFDYDGREWMIQIWKGNYLVTNGGEIGVYNRDSRKVGSYYDCVGDADMLEMSMKILHGEEEILSLDPARHWWINGFKMGWELYDPDSLTMDATITLKDAQMCEAFCNAIDNNYRHDVRYTVEDLTVHLVW